MATVTNRDLDVRLPDVRFLYGVPYKTYVRLIRHPNNRHTRMAYYDGTLEIVSPIYYVHEGWSRRLSVIVTMVAKALNLDYNGTGGMSFHRAGDGPLKGKGKEPDQSFYFESLGRFPFDRNPEIDAGDPPPDLWIEVDHRVSSKGRLPVYAALGVPEVWQYRVNRKVVRFLRLIDGIYQPTDRSLSLPVFTPARVLEAMALGQDVAESEFVRRLEVWIPEIIARAANDFQAE